MTLTEEQRAALKRVIAYMNRMYGIASPYYGCTEDANILRAMIDSSDQFGEPDELIGFDLERARGLRDFLQDDCAEVGDVWGEMIAEIERLQNWKDIAENRVAIIRRQITIIRNRDTLAEEQATEIERLRAENLELQVAVFGPDGIRANQACIIADQAARIKELEAQLTITNVALENATRKPNVVYITGTGELGPDADAKPHEGLYGKYRISKADGSPVDPNADYFVLRLDTDPVARRAAREYSYMTVDRKLALELQKRITRYNPKMMDCINLQFFGVEKPRVWQITEERKETLRRALEEYKIFPNDQAVLRAMLREAE